MVYNINVELQIVRTIKQTIKQTNNKMVKTRNQTQQMQQNKGEGLTTRSGLKLKTLETERVELPPVKLSKYMKHRGNVRKEIAKKSWKKQTDKKCKRFERVERDFLKHVYHNAGEMTAIWKNFEMAFRDIDNLLMFKKRVEGKSIILI
jgi:hypothetical protein